MTKCYNCQEELTFDESKKGPSGKKIPLNKDMTPHDCQGKYNNGNKTEQTTLNENKLTYKDYPIKELMDINFQAVNVCEVTYKERYQNAPEDKKLMMIMHWENIITSLRCRK